MNNEMAVRALGALAQESRLEVFRFLVRSGPEGVAAGEIARALEIPAPTLSFHLKELRSAGLVEASRRSRSISYRPSFPAVNDIVAFLMENCCAGSASCGSTERRPKRRSKGANR